MVSVASGEGHIVNGTKSCADKTATVYLTTGRLPAKDLTSRAPAGQKAKARPLPGPGFLAQTPAEKQPVRNREAAAAVQPLA
ncbi:alpha/beta hydrolase [Streptomyces goshikiensis]|uniref:alpha/beta hydrolase n=1 Tax=Streptomyces goshikiensis TaxID=1942 RepID=UPI0036884A75